MSAEEIFSRSMAALHARRFDEAEKGFRALLNEQPAHPAVLNLMGVLLTMSARYAEAEPYIRRAIAITPGSDATFYNHGIVLKNLGRGSEALEAFSRAIALNPNVAETWNNRGAVLNQLGRHREAVADFDRCLALDPDSPDAFCNKGRSLFALGDYGRALESYDKALQLRPDAIEALVGRAIVLLRTRRFEEALALAERICQIDQNLAEAWFIRGQGLSGCGRYEDGIVAFERSLALRPHDSEALLGLGNALFQRKRFEEARVAYKQALDSKPDLAAAWVGYGNALAKGHERGAALNAFHRALKLKPDLAEAYVGRGAVLADERQYEHAGAAFDAALKCNADVAEAWLGRGNILLALNRYEDANESFSRATRLKPKLDGVQEALLFSRMQLCDWRNFSQSQLEVLAGVRKGDFASMPFALLGLDSSPADQLACAASFVVSNVRKAAVPIYRGERYDHERIRVAYLSSDLHEHAIGYLIAGLFEKHDRSKFEITAIAISPNQRSERRQRIKQACDHFVEANELADTQIAEIVRDREVDILVDVNGFTQNARTGVAALRPAPVQVNYLGYPGTMGAPYIDYIIADQIIIPPEAQSHYYENCIFARYLPANRRRPLDRPDGPGARAMRPARAGVCVLLVQQQLQDYTAGVRRLDAAFAKGRRQRAVVAGRKSPRTSQFAPRGGAARRLAGTVGVRAENGAGRASGPASLCGSFSRHASV